jgi:DNA modification methylase
VSAVEVGLCYEPSSGGGSLLIAGEQLGRRVQGLEISPQYCGVCLVRWRLLTEREPILEGAGQTFSEAAVAHLLSEA